MCTDNTRGVHITALTAQYVVLNDQSLTTGDSETTKTTKRTVLAAVQKHFSEVKHN